VVVIGARLTDLPFVRPSLGSGVSIDGRHPNLLHPAVLQAGELFDMLLLLSLALLWSLMLLVSWLALAFTFLACHIPEGNLPLLLSLSLPCLHFLIPRKTQ
jgi:hypothetical protein